MSEIEFFALQYELYDLPYVSDQKWTVRAHLAELTKEFPTLSIAVQVYTYMTGRSVQLFVAEGTLPMYYQDVKYNIPVALWLPERYPEEAPILYVVPTPDMIIKPRHSFVDSSGVVRNASVVHWSTRSSLVDLCHSTSISFGDDPPLFQKPLNWSPGMVMPLQRAHPSTQEPPPPPPPPCTDHDFHDNPMNRPGPLQLGAQPFLGNPPSSTPQPVQHNPQPGRAEASPQHQRQPQQPQHNDSDRATRVVPVSEAESWESSHLYRNERDPVQQSEAPSPAEDLTVIFKERAVAALTERLRVSLLSTQASAREQLEKHFETQTELEQRGIQLRMTAEEMAGERHALENCVIEMNTKGSQILRWLAENESKTPTGEVDPDEAIVAVDPLAAQALEVQAEDLAIEDTLYALQKAFQAGLLDAPTYLRQVRQLCSKQFLARALGMKVSTRQHALAQRRPAASSQHQPRSESWQTNVAMPPSMGDSWGNLGMLANPLAG